MWELRMVRLVLLHISRLTIILNKRRLDVHQLADRRVFVNEIIAYGADRNMPATILLPLLRLDHIQIDLNIHAKVRPYLSYRHPQIIKSILGILSRITADDELTPSPDELIKAEIVKMPSIGKIEIFPVLISLAEQLGQQVEQSRLRPLPAI